MQELKEILLHHAAKYPLMQPTDAVKLLYQNEFGGGHLIRDEAACLSYLQREYAATVQTDTPLYEDIGNGIVRIHLAALDAHSYSPEQLGQDFIRSASAIGGSLEQFLQKVAVLEKLTQDGCLPFSSDDLSAYLIQYKSAGYPPVSHSEMYRSAYHPAYRVLSAGYLPGPLLHSTDAENTY